MSVIFALHSSARQNIVPLFSVLARSCSKMSQANPKVFFDITIGGDPAGTITMEVCFET